MATKRYSRRVRITGHHARMIVAILNIKIDNDLSIRIILYTHPRKFFSLTLDFAGFFALWTPVVSAPRL